MKRIIIIKLFVACIALIVFLLLMQKEQFREMRGFLTFVFVIFGCVLDYYLKKKLLH